MKMMPWRNGLSVLAGVLVLAGAADGATAKIKHRPLKYFVPAHRIQVEATVKDKAGVDLVRCYFRAVGEANFVFVGMDSNDGETYKGILPAPGKETKAIEYLFLVVNKQKVVVRTQQFSTPGKDGEKTPAWQQVPADGKLNVYTELDKAPDKVVGFTDDLKSDVVDSAVRFGLVAEGIYVGTQIAAAGAGGAAASGAGAGAAAVAGATAGGTVAASTPFLSGAAIAAIAGGAAVVGGGAAVAAGSGGGGGDSDADHQTQPDSSPNASVVGTWSGSGSGTCGGGSGVVTFRADGTVTVSSGGGGPNGSGRYSVSGSHVSATVSGDGGGASFSGNVSGNVMSGTYSSSEGCSGSFSVAR